MYFLGGKRLFWAFFLLNPRLSSVRWEPRSHVSPRLIGPDVFTYVLERMDSPLGHETTEIMGDGRLPMIFAGYPENFRNADIMIMYIIYIFLISI